MAIFTNQATLTYRNNVVNSNIVMGEILETLTVTKQAILPTYEAGGNIVYVVNLTNSGDTALNGLILTDDLGAYTVGGVSITPLSYVAGSLNYFIDGVLAASPTVTSTDPLVATGISLPAGAVGTLVYQAVVNQFAPLEQGGEITNVATFTGGSLAEPVSDSETVTVNNAPRLDITKAITPVTVEPNGQITYTFTILNYGNTATLVGDNVAVSDVFDPALNAVTVTYNGAPWTAGTEYNYNSVTGEFSTVPGVIEVPAATYTQDPVTGAWSIAPGQAVITVTGNVAG
jgi:uncharacterized repeat protein (TIGR01451 family)